MAILTLNPIENGWLDQANPTVVQEHSSTLSVKGGVANYKRALMYFDLSELPAGATIVSATLRLYRESASTTAHVVHRVTELWSSNRATWNVRTSVDNWSVQGGTYAATPAPGLGAGTGVYVEADVLALLEASIAAEEVVFSVLIRSTAEGGITSTTYAYSAIGAANPPVMEIQYTEPDPPPDPEEAATANSRVSVGVGVGL